MLCICIQGYKKRSAYIAAQAPLRNTVDDFWKLIWEFKTKVIVQVCSFNEGGEVRREGGREGGGEGGRGGGRREGGREGGGVEGGREGGEGEGAREGGGEVALSKGTGDLCVKSCHALLLALSYTLVVAHYISDYKCGKKVKLKVLVESAATLI